MKCRDCELTTQDRKPELITCKVDAWTRHKDKECVFRSYFAASLWCTDMDKAPKDKRVLIKYEWGDEIVAGEGKYSYRFLKWMSVRYTHVVKPIAWAEINI